MKIFLVLLGVGLMAALRNVQSKVSIKSVELDLLRRTSAEVNYKIALNLRNDSAVPVPVNSFLGGIYYGDRRLSVLQMDGPIVVNPGDSRVTLSGSIEYINLAANLIDLITTGDSWKGNLYAKGTMNVAGVRLPVNKKISVNDLI